MGLVTVLVAIIWGVVLVSLFKTGIHEKDETLQCAYFRAFVSMLNALLVAVVVATAIASLKP